MKSLKFHRGGLRQQPGPAGAAAPDRAARRRLPFLLIPLMAGLGGPAAAKSGSIAAVGAPTVQTTLAETTTALETTVDSLLEKQERKIAHDLKKELKKPSNGRQRVIVLLKGNSLSAFTSRLATYEATLRQQFPAAGIA